MIFCFLIQLSLNSEININRTLANEIKHSKFYARGQTNIDGGDSCNTQSRWGPAKDFSYFLYDFEPFEANTAGNTAETRKRRMKRKHQVFF